MLKSFWISPCVWPNLGYWPCLFLTLHISIIEFILLKVVCLLGHGFDPVIPVSFPISVQLNMSETGYQFTRLRFYCDKYLIQGRIWPAEMKVKNVQKGRFKTVAETHVRTNFGENTNLVPSYGPGYYFHSYFGFSSQFWHAKLCGETHVRTN